MLDNKPLNRSELRKFGLTTGVIVAVLFGLTLPWLFESAFNKWPWVTAAILIGWALLHPVSLDPVYSLWMKIGHVLGWINTRIILAVLFYIVILPVGLIMRLFGNDPMGKKKTNNDSYRKNVSPHEKEQIERPF